MYNFAFQNTSLQTVSYYIWRNKSYFLVFFEEGIYWCVYEGVKGGRTKKWNKKNTLAVSRKEHMGNTLMVKWISIIPAFLRWVREQTGEAPGVHRPANQHLRLFQKFKLTKVAHISTSTKKYKQIYLKENKINR